MQTLSPILASRLEKAATDNGFDRELEKGRRAARGHPGVVGVDDDATFVLD